MEPLLSPSKRKTEPIAAKGFFHRRWCAPRLCILGGFLLLTTIVGLVLAYRFVNRPAMDFRFVAPVQTAVVSTKTLPLFYETVGNLEANRQVELRPEAAGTVQKIHFTEGQHVTSGELLAQLDDERQAAEILESEWDTEEMKASLSSLEADYKARQEVVKQAQAEWDLAASEYSRYQKLLEGDFVTRQDLEQRFARLKVVQAGHSAAVKHQEGSFSRLEQAKAAIEASIARHRRSRSGYADTFIRAPFSGQVSAKRVEMGDYITPSQSIVTLVQSDPIKVAFEVPEKYLNELKNGLAIELTAENQPDKVLHGKLVFVDPVVSPKTRMVAVKARIDNPDQHLRPGQYANVRLLLGRKENALMVPEQSIIPQGERYFLYTVDKGKAHLRFITVGARIPGWVEVVAGVKPGERVIVAGIQKVQDGEPVEELSSKPSGQEAR